MYTHLLEQSRLARFQVSREAEGGGNLRCTCREKQSERKGKGAEHGGRDRATKKDQKPHRGEEEEEGREGKRKGERGRGKERGGEERREGKRKEERGRDQSRETTARDHHVIYIIVQTPMRLTNPHGAVLSVVFGRIYRLEPPRSVSLARMILPTHTNELDAKNRIRCLFLSFALYLYTVALGYV